MGPPAPGGLGPLVGRGGQTAGGANLLEGDRLMESKKTYCTPTLRVYGDVREITRAVDNTGNADGGVAPRNRT